MNANSEEHLSRSSGDSDSGEQEAHEEEDRVSVRSRQSAQDARSSKARDSGSSTNSRISQSSSGSRFSSSSGFEDMTVNSSDDLEESDDDNVDEDSLSGSRFQSERDENSRDTSLFKDLQFASVVTIPDINKAVTIRVTGTMTMDEYLKRVLEGIQHVNHDDSFDFEEYSLFNVERSRWIEKRSRNIEVAGITISSPNSYLLRTTVEINVVLPNLKQVSMKVKANEKVNKVTKEICNQIGIKNKFEEFSLVENFQ
ncbi:MAG: Fermitin 2, partial [Marteilia pararefringens]